MMRFLKKRANPSVKNSIHHLQRRVTHITHFGARRPIGTLEGKVAKVMQEGCVSVYISLLNIWRLGEGNANEAIEHLATGGLKIGVDKPTKVKVKYRFIGRSNV